jgi:hypothetical protein
MRHYAMLALIAFGSTVGTYYATRYAIQTELPRYEWDKAGIDVTADLVRQCQSYCAIHKERLSAVSVLGCTCQSGRWIRW